MILGKAFQQRVKAIINNPVFDKPISNLKKDYSKRGVIILVTRIKPQLCK
jgi:hypothetical protein